MAGHPRKRVCRHGDGRRAGFGIGYSAIVRGLKVLADDEIAGGAHG
jgi:hypothetical protein